MKIYHVKMYRQNMTGQRIASSWGVAAIGIEREEKRVSEKDRKVDRQTEEGRDGSRKGSRSLQEQIREGCP